MAQLPSTTALGVPLRSDAADPMPPLPGSGAARRWWRPSAWFAGRRPRVHAEEPARDDTRDERFRAAVQSMIDPFGIYRCVRDAGGTIVDFEVVEVNDAACEASGLGREQQLGRRICDLWPALRGSALFGGYCDVVAGGQPMRLDSLPYEDGRGGTRVFDIRASRLGDGFVAVWRDVTHQRAIERQLQEAQARTDAFVATVAHELRNFLSPIQHATDVLVDASPLRPDAGRAVEVLRRQVGALGRLVGDLLDLARIRVGKFDLRVERVLLDDVIDRAVEAAAPAAIARSQRLLVSSRCGGAVVDGDRVRLVQAVANLLLNAAKFTPPGGRIEVRCAVRDGMAEVDVSDDGAGFDPALAGRLFDLFEQGRAAGHGGLGIGLHVVQQIMAVHGGRAAAASEGPGRGSMFSLRFPAGRKEVDHVH